MFSGDLVEYNAGIYTGDAQLTEWPDTLEKLRDCLINEAPEIVWDPTFAQARGVLERSLLK